jgi:hypothetical protein
MSCVSPAPITVPGPTQLRAAAHVALDDPVRRAPRDRAERILRLHVGVVVLEPLVDHGRARDTVALHAVGMLLLQVGLDASAEGADVSEGVHLSRHLHDDRRAARPPLEAEGLC